MTRPLLIALIFSVVVVLPVAAQPEKVKQAQETVRKMVDARGGQAAMIALVANKALNEAFPDNLFFSVRFRQFPVAFAPPEGMSSSNVVVVGKEIELIPNHEKLGKYLKKQFSQWKQPESEKAKAAVTAMNVLLQELFQDGFYEFEIVNSSAESKDGQIESACRSLVSKGGNGDIKTSILFGEQGNVKFGQSVSLRPGPRPRCQATKLLDRDPIVRYMAETELRFMGVAARPYLLEQLGKVDDLRLRRIIARMIRDVEAAGW